MPSLWENIVRRVNNIVMPWQASFSTAKFFFQDLFASLRAGDVGALNRLSSIADESFGRWFNTFGHHFAEREETTSIPALVHSAYGTVLELGACTGNQLSRLDKAKLTQVYGIERNQSFAPALEQRIKDLELGELYTPVWKPFEDAGAELERHGVTHGTVDCILSMQVLCSVDDPREAVKECWRWLKPGGELIFCEHGLNDDRITRVFQHIMNIFAPTMGGCRLTRPLMESLMVAEWETLEFGTDAEREMLFPRSWGRLKKPLKPTKVF